MQLSRQPRSKVVQGGVAENELTHRPYPPDQRVRGLNRAAPLTSSPRTQHGPNNVLIQPRPAGQVMLKGGVIRSEVTCPTEPKEMLAMNSAEV